MSIQTKFQIPQNVVEYYKIRYSKHNVWNSDEYYSLIVDLFGDVSGKRFLDVGFGFGEVLKKVLERGGVSFGIEIAKGAYDFVRREIQGAIVELAPAEKIPFDNSLFDIVLCNGTLEHFLDMNAGLKEIRRVLKKDGFLVTVVPNKNWIGNIYGMFGIAYAHRKLRNVLPDQLIEREFSLSRWLSVLEQNNFLVCGWQPWNTDIPLPLMKGISIKATYISSALCNHFIIKSCPI